MEPTIFSGSSSNDFESRTGLKIRKVNERGETFKNEKEFT